MLSISPTGPIPAPPKSQRTHTYRLALLCAAMALHGCGSDPGTPIGSSAPAGVSTATRVEPATAELPATAATPATLAQAAAVIDLSTYPLAAGAQEAQQQSVAALSYQASGTVETLFEAQRAALLEAGWSEAAGSHVTTQFASALLAKQTYSLSLTVMPGSAPQLAAINLKNHGNVQFAELPKPAGLTAVFVGGNSAIYRSDLPAPQSATAFRDALLAAGWEAYGSAGEAHYFRKHAVRLSLSTSAASGPDGKTMHNLNSELLSAELPALLDATELRFDGSRQELHLATANALDAVLADYEMRLAPLGWKASLDATTQIDGAQVMTYRNAPGDLITLAYQGSNDQAAQVRLTYQSKTPLDAMNRRLDEQAAAYLRAKGN